MLLKFYIYVCIYILLSPWDLEQDLENHTEKTWIPQALGGGYSQELGSGKQNGICKIKDIFWSKALKFVSGRAWLKGM